MSKIVEAEDNCTCFVAEMDSRDLPGGLKWMNMNPECPVHAEPKEAKDDD